MKKRRLLMSILIIFSIILLIDIYYFKGFKEIISVISNFKFRVFLEFAYWSLSSITIVGIAFMFFYLPKINLPQSYVYIFCMFSILMMIFVPKLVFIIFHCFEDIIFLISRLFSTGYRISIISKIGFFVSLISFFFLLYGTVYGRFNFKIKNIEIPFKNLPQEFDGFKIVQFSDLHIGSFKNNKLKLAKAIDLINKTNADIIVFTGDLVNNFADEIYEFEDILCTLKAKYGVYSILGNHDYGDYYDWKDIISKKNNLAAVINLERKIGFKLLLNENDSITINNQSIYILGVENWGKPPFPSYGKLVLALNNIPVNSFKVLLSHDPSHWDNEVVDSTNIDLTLSGHTHGMQLGINNKYFKWSPVSFKYKKWGGLYSHKSQSLFVSTGLGYIGYSGRVGINPEIVVISLKREI